jgi:hypothetical protein
MYKKQSLKPDSKAIAGLMIIFLSIIFGQTLFSQYLVYEELRGDDKIYYYYWFEKTTDGNHITVARVFEGDTTDKHILVTGPDYQTRTWQYTRFGEQTEVYAKLTPEGVHIKGYLYGDELDEVEELDDDEPWIQLFPMNPGMEQFVFSDEDEIVFWSIATERPADMEINSFSAEKEETGQHDEFGCEVMRVNFSPTGWKSFFWDGDYYFRTEDGRVMGYRGDGAPGKPSSKTTLIIEE